MRRITLPAFCNDGDIRGRTGDVQIEGQVAVLDDVAVLNKDACTRSFLVQYMALHPKRRMMIIL